MSEDIMSAVMMETGVSDLDEVAEPEMDKYLVFLSGGIYYAVDTKFVKEMLTQWDTSITWLPMLPPHIRGVINLRGGVVPIIDFRLLMGQMPEDRFSTVILDVEGVQIGILVDEVDQTVDIEKRQVLPVPYQSGMEAQKMVTGMYSLPNSGKTLMVLDCTQMMYGH
ncbi:chemotaxis protein CheW [Acutalibacter caecimuris]|uniref:chemotaxis protein CheW n=1 Tax=Acutalibacter caecimuris TaxID=3093657 RepID=UPI002AC96007|nr:chemotaxis protein CheW [Acutalibacter sp. M00118]